MNAGEENMPYAMDWYIPGAIVLSEYSGAVTKDEIRESTLELIKLLASTERPLVHTVTDISEVTEALPLTQVIGAIRETNFKPANGWHITVGEKSPMVKFVSNLSRQLLRMRTRTFDTMEEALAFLRETDSSIDWSKREAS
jgi:hypothetical protein